MLFEVLLITAVSLAMFLSLLFLLPFVDSILNGTVGNCDLSTPPTSWLTTSAIGILDWATAGVKPNGPNFCLNGNKSAEYVQVAYHINLSSSVERKEHTLSADNTNNACVNKDSRIQYCIPFCGEDLQVPVIKAALQSGQTWVVADLIEKEVNNPKWAITVLAVDYNNPKTHLNISSFLDPTVWCSVYIGINPKIGFPYLFEIQLGNVISQ